MGVRLAPARDMGPRAQDCQVQGGDNRMLTWLWWLWCRDPGVEPGRGTASSSEDLD